jgi:hypothetical protein
MTPRSFPFDKTCFVVSPFGATPAQATRYRSVLDELIRPAVESTELGLHVVRGDEFSSSGSFLGEILEYLAEAHSVIADLSGTNPNVFYELGVRHALSPRTILIAERIGDIPSDLREYRALIYGRPLRAETFQRKLRDCLLEIAANPDRPDNPVWGHLRVPSLPDDLRQTFGARRIGVGDTQVALLLFIERAASKNRRTGSHTAISEAALKSRFKMSGTELYYRLEQLRLLGFLIKTRADADSPFTYDLSPAYWRELSA